MAGCYQRGGPHLERRLRLTLPIPHLLMMPFLCAPVDLSARLAIYIPRAARFVATYIFNTRVDLTGGHEPANLYIDKEFMHLSHVIPI